MTETAEPIAMARRIADAIGHDTDGHGLPTPRPLLLALADRLETLDGEGADMSADEWWIGPNTPRRAARRQDGEA